MATMELSLDPEVKEQFKLLLARAKQERRSEQNVVAEMVRAYNGQRLIESLHKLQKFGKPAAEQLGLKDEDDVERYLSRAA